MRKDITRLDEHRRAMRLSGGKLPLLLMEDLSSTEHERLAKSIFSTIGKNPEKDPLRVYAQVLASWGVMCPHPRSMRRYEDDASDATWPWKFLRYSCAACDTEVLKEETVPTSKKVVSAGGAVG